MYLFIILNFQKFYTCIQCILIISTLFSTTFPAPKTSSQISVFLICLPLCSRWQLIKRFLPGQSDHHKWILSFQQGINVGHRDNWRRKGRKVWKIHSSYHCPYTACGKLGIYSQLCTGALGTVLWGLTFWGGVVSKGYIITADGCYRRGVIVFSEGANGEFSMLSCAHHLSWQWPWLDFWVTKWKQKTP